MESSGRSCTSTFRSATSMPLSPRRWLWERRWRATNRRRTSESSRPCWPPFLPLPRRGLIATAHRQERAPVALLFDGRGQRACRGRWRCQGVLRAGSRRLENELPRTAPSPPSAALLNRRGSCCCRTRSTRCGERSPLASEPADPSSVRPEPVREEWPKGRGACRSPDLRNQRQARALGVLAGSPREQGALWGSAPMGPTARRMGPAVLATDARDVSHR